MRCRAPRRSGSLLLVCLSSVLSCDGTSSVSLTAEDFRFVPEVLRVSSSSPLTLSVYNAGRERHEVDSPALRYAVLPVRSGQGADSAGGVGLTLAPGQSVRFVMTPPPGTYLYICRRKGHAGMTGTLIVE